MEIKCTPEELKALIEKEPCRNKAPDDNENVMDRIANMTQKIDWETIRRSAFKQNTDTGINQTNLTNQKDNQIQDIISCLQRCQEILLFFLAKELLNPDDPRYQYVEAAARRGVIEWYQSLRGDEL